MKLLFDENLSSRLVTKLADIYDDCVHVRDVGLESASDSAVWDFAAREGFTIVTKDADFRQRSFLFGHPPKTIWIRLGNCSTDRIIDLLRRRSEHVSQFISASGQSFLSLG